MTKSKVTAVKRLHQAYINQLILQDDRITNEQLVTMLCLEINELAKQFERPVIVALVAGEGAGKTTLANLLKKGIDDAEVISADDFVVADRKYRRKHFEEDNPLGKYDFKLMNDKVFHILDGKKVKVPSYNELTGVAIAQGEENYEHIIDNPEVLLVEGDFLGLDRYDLMIYLDVPDQVRLSRRIARDEKMRNETAEEVKENFSLRQETQFSVFTAPLLLQANIVIQSFDDRFSIYRDFSKTIEYI